MPPLLQIGGRLCSIGGGLGSAPAAGGGGGSPPSASVLTTTTEDATRDFYDGALQLSWENANAGDWIDSAGVAQGSTPFTSLGTSGVVVGSQMDFNVLSLIQNHPAQFFVASSGTTGLVQFHSKEAASSSNRPKLIINGGAPLECTMDCWLDSSTFHSNGTDADLWTPAIIHFDQDALPSATSAVLRLTCEGRFSGNPTISIYRANPHAVLPTSPASMPADGTASDIIRQWGADVGDGAGAGGSWLTMVGNDMDDGFPEAGRYTANGDGSLTCTVVTGDETAADLLYQLPSGGWARKLYLRYYMKLDPSFKPTIGGKLPGLANTGQTKGYSDPNLAGWGARMANGTQWSCRTNRWPYISGANEFVDDYMGWSPYGYRLDPESSNGDGPSNHVPLPYDEWFCVDQCIALNTVSPSVLADGHCTYWLNGVCVQDWNNVKWVDNASTETYISEFWLNVYIGGVDYVAPSPHIVYFKKAIVSSKRLPFDQDLLDTLNGI